MLDRTGTEIKLGDVVVKGHSSTTVNLQFGLVIDFAVQQVIVQLGNYPKACNPETLVVVRADIVQKVYDTHKDKIVQPGNSSRVKFVKPTNKKYYIFADKANTKIAAIPVDSHSQYSYRTARYAAWEIFTPGERSAEGVRSFYKYRYNYSTRQKEPFGFGYGTGYDRDNLLVVSHRSLPKELQDGKIAEYKNYLVGELLKLVK